MELFESLRVNIGSARLQKKLAGAKREKSFTNFKNVNRIGIVWDASIIADLKKLTDFVQVLRTKNISVEILGYYPGKELPETYTTVKYLKCFKRKELNFCFTPISNEVIDFVSTPFDILIDLNFKKCFPLSYVSSLSISKFKVGQYGSEEFKSPFDLMMDIKNYSELEKYLSQVIFYLEMINGSENSAGNTNQSIKN